MSQFSNRMTRSLAKLEKLPRAFRSKALNLSIKRAVKYIGTTGIQIESISYDKCQISLLNKKKVQNHIGTIHAGAVMLMAESCTGLILSMNLPDTCIPLVKNIHFDFKKRWTGTIKAIATLSQDQISFIRNSEKGELTIPIQVIDETNLEPLACEVIWAWIPKKKLD